MGEERVSGRERGQRAFLKRTLSPLFAPGNGTASCHAGAEAAAPMAYLPARLSPDRHFRTTNRLGAAAVTSRTRPAPDSDPVWIAILLSSRRQRPWAWRGLSA